MRYVDTGSRDAKNALGSWLGSELIGAPPVTSLRVQTGFFGSDSLGYFEDVLAALAQVDGHTRFLIGSNDGQTPRSAISDLLGVVGAPRAGLGVGIVSFQSGFFHPKTYHIEREDGTSTAYVGSANLTLSGVTSLHVEAGSILDSRLGDPPQVLASIADAVDSWFAQSRPGLYIVATDADVAGLETAGVIGVPAPPKPQRSIRTTIGGQHPKAGYSLTPLVSAPALRKRQSTSAAPPGPPSGGGVSRSSLGASVAHWSKTMPLADAQRRAGNQSGALALTQGDYRHKIDQTRYFRHDLFGLEQWQVEKTPGRKPVDATYVSMRVTVDGVDHGNLVFRVSHAAHRESATNSPTTYLHLEPLLALFSRTDMTNKKVEIERYQGNTYALTIS